MRGAMPDVECPRCNATFAPTFEKLVTCAKCALVFTPHEVMHRPPNVVPLEVPSTLQMTTDGDIVTVVSKLSRFTGVFILLVMLVMLALLLPVMVNRRALSWDQLVVVFVIVIVIVPIFLYVAVVNLVGYRIITIDPASFFHRIGPLPAPWDSPATVVSRKDVPAVCVRQVTARRSARRSHPTYVVSAQKDRVVYTLFVSRHEDIAEFVRDLVAQTWRIPVE
jgi:hypothetical protein